MAIVLDEHIPLFEGVLIQKHINALARRQLAIRVLRVYPLLTTAQTGAFAALFKFGNDFLHRCLPFN